MSKVFGYIRVSTIKQDIDAQHLEVLEYARRNDIKVDEFIRAKVSSRQTSKERRIDELLEKLQADDTLIVSEMSRLGRSTSEVIALINELVKMDIRIIIIKQNLNIKDSQDMTTKVMVTLLSLFAELERDMISLRTREALATKKRQGVRLGKPPGTIQESKFDKDRKKIEELLGYGVSIRKIAHVLGYGSHRGLSTYVKKRIKTTN